MNRLGMSGLLPAVLALALGAASANTVSTPASGLGSAETYPISAVSKAGGKHQDPKKMMQVRIRDAQRKAAARAAAQKGVRPSIQTTGKKFAGTTSGGASSSSALTPLVTPDYFGAVPNWANSPLPEGGASATLVGGGGTGATASVTVASGVVVGVGITDGGSGYTVAPDVVFSGNGTGAAATANLLLGVLGGVSVTDPGAGYDSASPPSVTIAAPPPGGTPASAVATIAADGTVLGVTVVSRGSGYDPASPPAVTIADPPVGGTTATASVTVTNAVDTVTVTNGGTGYNLTGTGIRKFVDSLPGLGAANANDLGQYLPVGVPDTTTYPGSDYYEIELGQYTEQLHRDLPPTTLRGYRQTNTTDVTVSKFSYLGPVIVAHKGRPVRVKFTNSLPTGTGGDLFLPVDTTAMGAGTGPNGGTELYSENRATVHLHGGFTPWISDGTPHQWVTPAGETTSYPKGVSVSNVPDMPDPGPGALTFFYSNQQSARLMFYHDHTYGMTRLNVYAGEAAGYVLDDPVEQQMVADGVIPADQLPLIIQDKTFVPGDAQLAAQDPTWNKSAYGGLGNLWFPHVYMPNQNPYDPTGANPMGRWDYGPWFWPPYTGLANGPVPNPYYDPANAPWEPPTIPGTPNPSFVPEGFMDTPLVNGTVYPYVTLQPKAYRLRILNASNDRTLNLQLYYAASNATMWNADGTLNNANAGEVPMVAAVKTTGYPAAWPTDGRDGGVPNPSARGPRLIQIGTEGGFLPNPVAMDSTPVNYNYNRRDITVLNVTDHTLMLGPAERADVIVDFSQVPAGSNLILYNDAPAPVPAFDPRNDYYTGSPDLTAVGGAPSTQPGYGPNTRTIMQIRVEGTAAPAFDATALNTRLPAAFAATQDKPVVPEAAYGAAYNTTYPNNYVRIQDTKFTFTPAGATAPVTMDLAPKAIQELFEIEYGRMNATLGVELPNTSATTQTTIPMGYAEPGTETVLPSDLGQLVGTTGDGTQIWKITHNGVDTHAIHFHLFNVQLINRVGWDGAIKPPDANELGWKETVRMNPLEDAMVALRPTVPDLPFKVPDSIRSIDPTRPASAMISTFDPRNGNAITVPNTPINFGWEYVWHCHLLGHEENDMMRPIKFQVSPAPATNLTATASGAFSPVAVTLAWSLGNGQAYPPATNYLVQRATNAAFTADLTTTQVPAPATSWTDQSAVDLTTYYYRVRAETKAGYTGWSNVAQATTVFASPTNLTAAMSASPPLAINLAWTNNSKIATGFTIQRSTKANFTQNLQTFTVTGAVPSFTDTTGLAAARTYYYRVRANSGALVSNWSPTAVVSTDIPTRPASLTATVTPASPLFVTLLWSSPLAGEVVGGYTIQRATNSGFTQNLVTISPPGGQPAGTTFLVDNGPLASNTTYYYRILAFNGAGASAWRTTNVTTPA
jgi:FtsP/CotA-like multicopper oxidase with cupredoxin domain